ncbi:MAG: Spy/CpxP family protein refolding chaperone [Mesorhizobium sp.]
MLSFQSRDLNMHASNAQIMEVEMSRSWIGTALATVAAITIISSPAVSEDHSWWPHWGWDRMMGDDWGPGVMGWWGRQDGVVERIDGRLAYMKTELKITSEQAAAWDAFAAVVRTSVETHNDMMRSTAKKSDDGAIFDKPLPERLASQITRMEARLAQIKSVKVAADDLYAVLTNDQKAVADDVVLPLTGLGMGRSQGRHMMRW